MLKMDKEKLKNRIEKAGLKQDYIMPLSLLSLSCVARGHTILMKEKFGFSCSTIGAIGNYKQGRLFINYKDAYIGVEKVLNKNWSGLDKLFKEIKKESQDITKKIKLEFDPNNPLKSFSQIANYYQKYVTNICFYACFWKYLDNTNIHSIFRLSLRQQILFDHVNAIRTQKFFVKKIRKLFNELGKAMSIDADLFRCMTIGEFEIFIKTQSIDFQKIQELLSRKKLYHYLYFGDINQEYILNENDTEMLVFINNTLYPRNQNIVSGSSAFSGKITGTVFKPSWFNKRVKPGQIIVAKSNLVNSNMINICGALVIENGGILDHTAILSREMRKPCILSAAGATKIFKNGDKIEVDASNGLAKKVY